MDDYTIHQKVNAHRLAYQGYSDEMPPYRMTCAEHKFCRIKSYLGVDIELVAVIEDYT